MCREAFVSSDCSFQQRGKPLTELQLPTSNQGISPFINMLRVQTPPGCPVLSQICLKTHTTPCSCQPSALKHTPECWCSSAWGWIQPSAVHPPFKGAFGRKQLFSSHPHVSPRQTGAVPGVGTHLIDGDGGSVGQVHLQSLFPLPRRSKEQRRAQGVIPAWRTLLLHSRLGGKSPSLAR